MDLIYEVKNNKYLNIKEVLRSKFGISSRLYIKLRNNNKIFLNGVPTSQNKDIFLNDIIEVDLNFDEESPNIVSTKMDLNILYEDKYLLIVNKPPYIPVHPSMGYFKSSLSNGVKYYFETIRS